MKRSVGETRVGEHMIRYRTHIEDDAVPEEQRYLRQRQFLQILADNQSLLECGTSRFHSLRLYWGGSCWIAEAEATVEEGANG